jgi:hypothetical protein
MREFRREALAETPSSHLDGDTAPPLNLAPGSRGPLALGGRQLERRGGWFVAKGEYKDDRDVPRSDTSIRSVWDVLGWLHISTYQGPPVDTAGRLAATRVYKPSPTERPSEQARRKGKRPLGGVN